MKYNTKVGQKIIEYIHDSGEKSFCAADVYAYVTQHGLTCNLTTIYRNLDCLTEDKKLTKFKAANNEATFYRFAEENRRCNEHLHMQCRCCGRIFHLEGDFMRQITEYLKEHYQFQVEYEDSSISGICEACRK